MRTLCPESSVSETVQAGVSKSSITACLLNDLSAISGAGSYLPLIVSSVNVTPSGGSAAGNIAALFGESDEEDICTTPTLPSEMDPSLWDSL